MSMRPVTDLVPRPLRLPAAIVLAFAILSLAGLLWTPVAPGIRDWLLPPDGTARPQGFVLGSVILLPVLLVVWISLRLLPAIPRLESRGLMAILLISAGATLGWSVYGPPGSPDISYLLALGASWFFLVNRAR